MNNTGQCEVRWKEGKMNVVCGEPLPCKIHGNPTPQPSGTANELASLDIERLWARLLGLGITGNNGENAEQIMTVKKEITSRIKSTLKEEIVRDLEYMIFNKENCIDHEIVNPLCDRCASRQSHNITLLEAINLIKSK